jgi:osmotically-inducible protein OsmY
MKTNENLQTDVQNAIKWEPLLNAAEIGVTAKDGVVTLTGVVDSYAKKLEAEHAAKNVVGVRAVAEEIEVSYGSSFRKNDTEIASEILNAWKWNWEIPSDRISVKVENGRVTLDGVLEWNYQKEAAKRAVDNLIGVRGVTNRIKIKSETNDAVEKVAIEHSLARSWSIDTENVFVNVAGNHVKLTGVVGSLFQKDEASRLAWNAPGVSSVDNELIVDFSN